MKEALVLCPPYAMPSPDPLTEEQLLDWVDETALTRGRPYADSGAVFATRRVSSTLRARCQGSHPDAYHVEITLGPEGVEDALCSCPVGDDGTCKHVAATLLVWMREPALFRELQDIATLLADKTKEQLIAIIRQMLRHDPDLETLLDMPVAGSTGDAKPDAGYFRQQAEQAFLQGAASGDWRASYGISHQLSALAGAGDDYLEAREPESAAAVYGALIAAVVEHYGTLMDEEGQIAAVVHELVAGLESCLVSGPEEGGFRTAVLRSLFDVYLLDLRMGGIGIADAVPGILVELTNDAERLTVADWARAKLDQSSDWSRRALGVLLLGLEEERLSDEEYLTLCRDAGLDADLIDRLLALGRGEEALAHARTLSDYGLLTVADLFQPYPEIQQFEALVEQRLRQSQDRRLFDWLKDRKKARGDDAGALTLARRVFQIHPTLEGYREIKQLAVGLQRWPEVRRELDGVLKSSWNSGLKVQIHLLEGELDAAVEALARVGSAYFPVREEVAATLEAANRPLDAAQIHMRTAEALIQGRGRSNYQAACRHLLTARRLHQQAGEVARWDRYRAGLVEANRSLRALKEEMQDAGL